MDCRRVAGYTKIVLWTAISGITWNTVVYQASVSQIPELKVTGLVISKGPGDISLVNRIEIRRCSNWMRLKYVNAGRILKLYKRYIRL